MQAESLNSQLRLSFNNCLVLPILKFLILKMYLLEFEEETCKIKKLDILTKTPYRWSDVSSHGEENCKAEGLDKSKYQQILSSWIFVNNYWSLPGGSMSNFYEVPSTDSKVFVLIIYFELYYSETTFIPWAFLICRWEFYVTGIEFNHHLKWIDQIKSQKQHTFKKCIYVEPTCGEHNT